MPIVCHAWHERNSAQPTGTTGKAAACGCRCNGKGGCDCAAYRAPQVVGGFQSHSPPDSVVI
eukprot:235252-Chlamydomonas_euryale.AAC.1